MSRFGRAVAGLLALDPDLEDALPPGALEPAQRDLQVRTVHVPTGAWDPSEVVETDDRDLGLIIGEGLLLRRVQLGHRSAGELLGAGDLLRPWQESDGDAEAFSASWRVLQPLVVGVVDRRVVARLTRYPELVTALVARQVSRSRRSVERLATAQLVATEDRLVVELRRLAERWGRVSTEGLVLDLPLTHEVLGALVGARRPSVTAALGRLAQDGRVVPSASGGWLLTDAGQALALEAGSSRVICTDASSTAEALPR